MAYLSPGELCPAKGYVNAYKELRLNTTSYGLFTEIIKIMKIFSVPKAGEHPKKIMKAFSGGL